MGSTGYQPVPPGYQPGGRGGVWKGMERTKAVGAFLPFGAAGSRAAQAGCLCYPAAEPPLFRNSG